MNQLKLASPIQCNSLLNNENVDYVELMTEEYDVPDEHLSYSELKDRVSRMCKGATQKRKNIANGKEIGGRSDT
jgi:hypothetical protein